MTWLQNTAHPTHMLYLMRGQVYELEGYHFYTWMMQKVTTPITKSTTSRGGSRTFPPTMSDEYNETLQNLEGMAGRRTISSPATLRKPLPTRNSATMTQTNSRASCKKLRKACNTTTDCSALTMIPHD